MNHETETKIQDPKLREIDVQYRQYTADIPVVRRAMLEAVENGKQDRLKDRTKKANRIKKVAATGVAAAVGLTMVHLTGNAIDYEHDKRKPVVSQNDANSPEGAQAPDSGIPNTGRTSDGKTVTFPGSVSRG